MDLPTGKACTSSGFDPIAGRLGTLELRVAQEATLADDGSFVDSWRTADGPS